MRLRWERGIGRQGCPKHSNTWTLVLMDFNVEGQF